MQYSCPFNVAERRSKARYSIDLPVRYHTVGYRERVSGVGRTANISSNGILLISEHEFPVGMVIEISIQWPVLFDESTPLQLTGKGTVVRCHNRKLAVQIETLQFKTVSRRLAYEENSLLTVAS